MTDLIAELYEALESEPSSLIIHERLLEVWQGLGDEDMASGVAATLAQLDPNNKIARQYFKTKGSRNADSKESIRAGKTSQKPNETPSQALPKDWSSTEKDLEVGYTSLKLEATLLHEEFKALCVIAGASARDEEVISNLKAISTGDISSVIAAAQPLSVRETARAIMITPENCQELILADFETVVVWAAHQDPPLQVDAVRERLVKRKALLDAALPESMEKPAALALARIELEFLQKRYVNSETMLGDKIEDIPKPNFFVSEDNYAWDMDELAQAIAANDGVMRNPLSKQLFSESDIRMILAHPLGQRLKPMRLQQDQLKQGVRPMTIDWLGKLGRILLEDQTADTAPSRQALDEFLAYVVTLPDSEQKTINLLKIPARDTFSKTPFDYTIGESVKDAVANTTCLHKVGDFLSQAATYLQSG